MRSSSSGDAPVARVAASRRRLARLEVPLREDQREHGEANGAEQEALEAPSAGGHSPPSGRTGDAVVGRLGRPALLQLVPDSPQTRREQMSHGARRGSAGAARRIAGQEQRLVNRQAAHLLGWNARFSAVELVVARPSYTVILSALNCAYAPSFLLIFFSLLYYSLQSHMVRGLHHLLPKELH